jgi:hypothetical protein
MKKLAFGIFLIVAFYFIGLFTIGEKQLFAQIINENKSTFNTYQWTKEVIVISNFKTRNFETLDLYFQHQNLNLKFQLIHSQQELNDFKGQEDTYYYFLVHGGIYPITIIYEYENIEEYLASYQMKYIWFFYRWIKIDDISTGIS